MAKKEYKEEPKEEMSMEEARAFRAALYIPKPKSLTEAEKREQFRMFWAREKRKYDRPKNLEPVLWLHLKAAKLDSPEQFEAGIKSFGLKKVK
jgi:hypothetical protein